MIGRSTDGLSLSLSTSNVSIGLGKGDQALRDESTNTLLLDVDVTFRLRVGFLPCLRLGLGHFALGLGLGGRRGSRRGSGGVTKDGLFVAGFAVATIVAIVREASIVGFAILVGATVVARRGLVVSGTAIKVELLGVFRSNTVDRFSLVISKGRVTLSTRGTGIAVADTTVAEDELGRVLAVVTGGRLGSSATTRKVRGSILVLLLGISNRVDNLVLDFLVVFWVKLLELFVLEDSLAKGGESVGSLLVELGGNDGVGGSLFVGGLVLVGESEGQVGQASVDALGSENMVGKVEDSGSTDGVMVKEFCDGVNGEAGRFFGRSHG